MRRRYLLASAALTLSSGCIGGDESEPTVDQSNDDNDEPDSVDEQDTDSTTDDPSYATIDDEFDPIDRPDGLPGSELFDLEAPELRGSLVPATYRVGDGLQARITIAAEPDEDGPLIVAASVTNEAEYTQYVRARDIPPFNAPRNASVEGYADRRPETNGSKGRLTIRATAESPFIDADPNLLRDQDGIWQIADPDRPQSYPDVIRLDPGQTLYGEFAILSPSGSGAVQPGRYEFMLRDRGFGFTLWESGHPGPIEESRFAGSSVPTIRDGTMNWYHEADATTETYLYPSAEQVELPELLTFTFVNHADESAGGNPFDWALHKLVDGRWYKIAPWMLPLPFSLMAPGTSRSYSRVFFNDAGFEVGYDAGADRLRPIPYLGGGTYAISVGFSVGDGRPTALVELEGDPVTVSASDDVEILEQDNDRVRLNDPSAGMPRYVVQLTEADEDVKPNRRLIPEQVMQSEHAAVRNLLAYRHDAEVVEIQVSGYRIGLALGSDEEHAHLAFEDGVYRIERVE